MLARVRVCACVRTCVRCAPHEATHPPNASLIPPYCHSSRAPFFTSRLLHSPPPVPLLFLLLLSFSFTTRSALRGRARAFCSLVSTYCFVFFSRAVRTGLFVTVHARVPPVSARSALPLCLLLLLRHFLYACACVILPSAFFLWLVFPSHPPSLFDSIYVCLHICVRVCMYVSFFLFHMLPFPLLYFCFCSP